MPGREGIDAFESAQRAAREAEEATRPTREAAEYAKAVSDILGADYDRIRAEAETTLGALPDLGPMPAKWSSPETPLPRRTPAESSVSFVLARPNDDTLIFSIEFDGQEPGEEMCRATYDEDGSGGLDMLERTVLATAAAIGARVVRR